MRKSLFFLLVPFFLIASPALAGEDHHHRGGDPEKLGSVELPNSCAPAVQPQFSRALAMLHSFWYDEAVAQFTAVGEKDPDCAMAWWGVAMSHWQPLWEPRGPNPDAFARGVDAIGRAAATGKPGDYERGFIAALQRYYADAESVDHLDRVLAYEAAMEALHAAHPDDTEARVFYALSLLGSQTSLPPDKSYRRQRKAGELLMPVFRAQPNHPGAAHYIIHAYDYPALASGALEAARSYAKIAPDSPHAQHMPSHIFTRLGLWDESIASNRNVIRVAQKYGIVGEELHGRDYLVFAHLQKGEDAQAREIMAGMPASQPGAQLYFAGVYAHAAIPARYAVERRRWQEAARLPEPTDFPGGRYGWADAAVYFVRAVGAARTGDVAQARADVEKIQSFQRTLKEHKEDYWATQVEIQRRAAAAWLALAEDRREEALALMRSAAELEDTTDKHPVTPGQIIAAHDLLGQMLMELDRPAEALPQFEAVLGAEPNRFGPLYGAAQAAMAAGRHDLARERYAQLVELAGGSDREEVRLARVQLERSGELAALED